MKHIPVILALMSSLGMIVGLIVEVRDLVREFFKEE